MSANEGEFSGVVAVDDSGTPGAAPSSASLHPQRKTWAAVIVPPAAVVALRHALEIFIAGVRGDYGVDELHFTDIYNGRGAFKDVSIEQRYELFALMAELFRSFKLPILVQTCSPESLAEMREQLQAWPTGLPWFKLDNHEHVALLFLLCRVRLFIREQRQVLPRPLSLVIDEGPLKAGASLSLPGWADLFVDGRAQFESSHQNPFLQLADFAAFAVARAQWIASGGIRKHRDRAFLELISPEHLWFVNLPVGVFSANENAAVEYHRALSADRVLKGLPPGARGRGRVIKGE